MTTQAAGRHARAAGEVGRWADRRDHGWGPLAPKKVQALGCDGSEQDAPMSGDELVAAPKLGYIPRVLRA